MAQRVSIGLFHRPLYGVARLLSAALGAAIVAIGLLATAATPPSGPSLSTVMQSARLPPSPAAVASQSLIRDRASRASDDDYLERLVEALDHDP
jgi:hypothetical protein